MRDSDFDAKPMVLLLGQYSVGKTSFIRYLIGKDFPGARIGPEPTTDRFNAVMGGPEDRIVPGNALAVDQSMPFSSLTRFGTEFLNKFQASMCNCPILDKLYFVDTPGVLSGEKQKLGRSYDFVKVTEWFAQRADLILLLFDAHKLDISDEFQSAIKALKGQDDKVRVVLNKADKITSQQLYRVYGAMMWSLGKVVATPEVARVYIGSFWDGPCQNPSMEAFFKMEQSDLLKDLHELPRNAAVRKVNELVKRTRMARVHALIIGHLKNKMPFFGQAAAQKEMLDKMADEFFAVMQKTRLPQGDFPNIQRFKDVASTYDFAKFKKTDDKLMGAASGALEQYIPDLLRQLGDEMDARAAADKAKKEEFMAVGDEGGAGGGGGGGGSGGSAPSSGNPFGGAGVGGRDPYAIWAAQVNKQESDSVYKLLPGGQEGLVSGSGARDYLLESGLESGVLRRIWDLSDVDKDGYLSPEEFALCCYLVNNAKAGRMPADSLPPHLCVGPLGRARARPACRPLPHTLHPFRFLRKLCHLPTAGSPRRAALPRGRAARAPLSLKKHTITHPEKPNYRLPAARRPPPITCSLSLGACRASPRRQTRRRCPGGAARGARATLPRAPRARWARCPRCACP